MRSKSRSGSRNGARLWAVIIPLGALVTFLALFRIALVNYLGSITAWYILFSIVVALLVVQLGLLAFQGAMERSPALQNLLRRRLGRGREHGEQEKRKQV